jgi:hypothetical protein
MKFTIEDFHMLLESKEGPCVSLFMPTHQAGPDTQQDPIRLKNLLKETERQLTAKGVRSSDIQAWLEPLTQLLKDENFWRHQESGLSVFIAQDWHRIYRLPVSVSELVVVEPQFYLKPLLPVFIVGGKFYLLALSQNKIRFFSGSNDGLREIFLEKIPQSLAEASLSPSEEPSLQFHTGAPGTGDKRAAIFHGHGGGHDEVDKRIKSFFQQIDKGMNDYLGNTHAPLFLTGVEYLFPIYRETNTYPQLIDIAVKGNADEKSLSELYRQIWPFVQKEIDCNIDQAKARCEELLGTAMASKDLESVVLAAVEGKIDTLFVAQEIQQWGRIDIHQNRVELHQSKTPDSQEILDFAAAHTILKNGTVFALPQERMPDHTSLAAVYRY